MAAHTAKVWLYHKCSIVLPVLLCSLLSYCIPKKKGLVAFFPRQCHGRFEGNLKYLFLAMASAQTPFTPLWLTANKSTHSALRQKGYGCVYYRLIPLWALLRSEYILLDNYGYHCAFGRFKLVQLWHGSGFKRIGLPAIVGGYAWLRRYLLKSVISKSVLIAACSPADAQRKAASWESANVQVTGAPRNDVFFNPDLRTCDVKEMLGIGKNQRLIVYAPTRSSEATSPAFEEGFWDKLAQWLKEHDSYFLVKCHPQAKDIVLPKQYKRIIHAPSNLEDVQELLMVTDILISDYSSLTTDFALLGRPIIFYLPTPFPQTSFYYDLETTLPGPLAYTQIELLALMGDTAWFEQPEYQARFQAFVDTFHSYRDSQSSRRVLSILESLYHA